MKSLFSLRRRTSDTPADGAPPAASPSNPAGFVHEIGDDGQTPDAPLVRRRSRLRTILRWMPRVLAVVLLLLIVLVGWLAVTAPLSKSLKPISPPRITLLASDGTPIARKGANVMAPVTIGALPRYVPGAFVSIEDRRFYEHGAIDPRGIARATLNNLLGHHLEGGSTITQQLAKFTFLSSRRTLARKAQEVLIAFWLEAWLTKDQILERYMSNAYFGDNCYGLRAAAMHYFHRRPENLTPAQAAMLAGLMKAPSSLAPTDHYDAAVRRMRLVIHAMVRSGYLTKAKAAAIRDPKLDVRQAESVPTGTYFADWALPEARKLDPGTYAEQTYTTTLDARLQAAARKAISGVALGHAQVALVAMHPNGEVVAMVGGRDYADSPFNRATQARRQPGSTFKLFVYLAALRKGWTPEDRIDNQPFTSGSYRPQNAGGHYSKSITLADAFARSSNVAAVRLFDSVGDKAVIDMARDLGVTSPLPQGDPSMALGTASMSLLELTSAYAGVAGNRFPVTPTAMPVKPGHWYDWLVDRRHSLSNKVHAEMEQLLRGVVSHGTARAIRLRSPAFGKTGTSQDNRDALFVGYSGDLVVGVWVGNDDDTPLKGVYGGGAPARIWGRFMRQALHETAPVRPRANPSGPVEPLDVPDLGDLPVKVGNLQIDDGTARVTGALGGIPLDVTIGKDGINFNGQRLDAPQSERAAQATSRPSPSPTQAPAARPGEEDEGD